MSSPFHNFITLSTPLLTTINPFLPMEEKALTDTILVANRQSNMAGEEKAESPINSSGQEASEEYEYVTGFKLAMVIASVTLVFFLVMLDLAIIATVSQETSVLAFLASVDSQCRLFPVLQATSILCLMLGGTEPRIFWPSMLCIFRLCSFTPS